MLKPLTDFHSETDGSSEDLKMYWDVRLVQGNGEVVAALNGTTSMTGVLSDSMIGSASSMIYREISEKISAPLVGKLQKIAEDSAEDILAVRAAESARIVERGHEESESPMAIAERQSAAGDPDEAEEIELEIISGGSN
jgi:hypothetical protein